MSGERSLTMKYSNPPLILSDTNVTDALGTISLGDLPDPQPSLEARLTKGSALMERLWRIALNDIEYNIVETDGEEYFGAGAAFKIVIFTRDISYSGVLGLNRLYPDIMNQSLRLTRDVRLRLGFRTPKEYIIDDINVPWRAEEISEIEIVRKFHTNSYTRRTDDVVWLWCAHDLFTRHGIGED